MGGTLVDRCATADGGFTFSSKSDTITKCQFGKDLRNVSQEQNQTSANPLAVQPVPQLILRFAIPAIISFLVNALYNIVDQIFIGQGVGMLGNAATNVSFPLVTISTAIALLIGVGSASNFNLAMGRGDTERASAIAGSGVTSMLLAGVALCAVVLVFLEPLIRLFGATELVLPYAVTYTGITTLGLPFVIFSSGGSQLIRSDGSPTYSMVCVLTGAVLNTILDPLFIFGFNMGIAGAAWATIIGQIVSALMVVWYLWRRMRSVKFTRRLLRPRLPLVRDIASLGAAACFNQLAMTVVQIVMNNTLTHYGALSPYGREIPLACVGVISKVNIVFMAFVLGIAQGCQPICGFNYGARNYARVKRTYLTAAAATSLIALLSCAVLQLFPRQIVGIFGNGSEQYFLFAERYIRVFMVLLFLNGIQPLTSNFFTSIGKARIGIIISLTRQVLFLLPLIIIFPLFMGIDGVMYAGPIADVAAFLVSIFLILRELRLMATLETAPG